MENKDIETLEVFAYNRLLVKRWGEALLVYELLAHLQPQNHKWQLARIFCLTHKKLYKAAAQLSNIFTKSTNGKIFLESEKKLLDLINKITTHNTKIGENIQ